MPLQEADHARGQSNRVVDDTVAMAERRERMVTIHQIELDFGVSETCLRNWLRRNWDQGMLPARDNGGAGR